MTKIRSAETKKKQQETPETRQGGGGRPNGIRDGRTGKGKGRGNKTSKKREKEIERKEDMKQIVIDR